MGDVINLAERRAGRRTARAGLAPAVASAFYFDLSCPFSYLAGERVERMLGGADWRPAPVAFSGVDAGTIARMIVSRAARSEAERAAEILRLPLSWPENFGADCRGLHRAAACAAELGAAAPFALAALRLGFSGGFDLSDPITLAEAAAAARLPVQRCQEAAEDPRYDQVLYVNSRELQAAGLSRRPAIRIGGHWCEGRNAVIEAAALRTASAEIDTRPAG